MPTVRSFTTVVLTVAVVLAMTAVVSLAASQFEGTWNVADTDGKPFEITLAGDGTAKANRAGEGMTGTWKEEGTTAVITWDTGWTTKIAKDGNTYTKTAFKKGEPMGGKPATARLPKRSSKLAIDSDFFDGTNMRPRPFALPRLTAEMP